MKILFHLFYVVWYFRFSYSQHNKIPNARPSRDQRLYQSKVIDKLVDILQPLFIDDDIAQLFSNCFPNTLDTTVEHFTALASTPPLIYDTFIVTGDIKALWLRDSTNQVLAYLPYATSDDRALQALIEGLINRQSKCILIDSFANAFNYNDTNTTISREHQDDIRVPVMNSLVFEGKYEIDSLCAFLKLSYWYYYYAQSAALLRFATLSWLESVEKVLNTIHLMQQSEEEIFSSASTSSSYRFERYTVEGMDTLVMGGRGPRGRASGLSRSLFRPSDDATVFPYNIPGNAMAYVELVHTTVLLESLLRLDVSAAVRSKCRDLLRLTNQISKPLHESLQKYFSSNCETNDSSSGCSSCSKDISGVGESQPRTHNNWRNRKQHDKDNQSPSHTAAGGAAAGGAVACSVSVPYEVDGYGSELHMDDANIPSLLSLPLIGYVSVFDPVYQSTRRKILSENNPFYFKGKYASGVGSPHTGVSYVWPMSLIVQAMTSVAVAHSEDDDDNSYSSSRSRSSETSTKSEIMNCLYTIVNSSKAAGLGLIHESFHVNNMSDYSRKSFAWVNGLWGELILYLIQQKPELIIKAEFIALAQSVVKPTVYQTIMKEAEFGAIGS